MVGVIVTGHANFATGLSSAVKLVFGLPEEFKIIDFVEEDSPEMLETKIKTAMYELKESSGIVCFTDIGGGTPFQVASRLSIQEGNMEVVTGTNLPMLLGVLSERDGMTQEEVVSFALETGKEEVKKFQFVISEKPKNNTDDGGI